MARMLALLVAVLFFTCPAPAAAQVPDVSVAAGVASVGTEGSPTWPSSPFVASIRVGLSKYFVAEVEWLQPMSARETFDTGDVGLATLNGQSGIYGRMTRATNHGLSMNSISVLARSRAGRVSFLVGAGIGRFKSHRDSVYTRTGCTGPWVVACQDGNGQFVDDRTGLALIYVGSVDVEIVPRVSAFVSGRIGGSNGVEEAAVAVGVRTALIPFRAGGTGASDASDSLANGLVVGGAAGAGVGVLLMYFDESRTLPAAIIIGAATGAFLDSLWGKKHDAATKKVAVSPTVSRSGAGAVMNIAWR